MPLYEYQCEACGHTVEKLQKRGAPAPEVCPQCGAEGALKRGISATSFHLKGGGWYVTDYKSDSSPPAASEASSPSETSSSSESSSGDDSAA